VVPAVTEPSHAVFLSHASQDAEAAQRICEALRAAGIEVWFDQSALRGGDAWDRQIRQRIHGCRLFLAVISANTEARDEGYFRREWKLAVDRTHDMAENKTFLVPIVIDDTSERGASVPDKFREVQWTRLVAGHAPPAFVARISALMGTATGEDAATPSAPAGSVAQARAPRRRIGVVWLGIAALLALAGAGWLASRHFGIWQPANPHTTREKSVAVLPFVDMSEKHDQEYFADGLSEEILNLLASVPMLQVIGRTSSFQFRGQNSDLRSIGAKLGAAYALEGSVRRAGDRVRVTAQLISTRDGGHLWSNTYDRSFGDVLQLQGELAAAVARALEVTVRSETLQTRGSNNSEAYDFYLRGLHSLESFNREGFESGASYFQQALDLDPNFATAATELGRMVLLQAEFGYTPAAATYERARRTLKTAVRLDPSDGAAHAWLGWIHMGYDWDWSAANSEMQEALRLAPRDPEVQLCASRLAMALGRWDEAINRLTAASARDPLFAALFNSLSEIYLRMDRLADAEAAERRVLEINPTYVSAPYNLASVLLAEGRPAEALTLVKTRQQDTDDRLAALAMIYHALGRKVDSDAQLAALIRRYQDDEAFQIADVLAFRGEADEAFSWMERAYRQRDAGLYLIKVDPFLKNIEADPRYKAFILKMKLPD
jgi:adenylate cyclase